MQIDVIDALGRLGETHERKGDRTAASDAIRRAIALAEALGTANPRWDEMRGELRAVLARIERARR
jgi:hypothetical protein